MRARKTTHGCIALGLNFFGRVKAELTTTLPIDEMIDTDRGTDQPGDIRRPRIPP